MEIGVEGCCDEDFGGGRILDCEEGGKSRS